MSNQTLQPGHCEAKQSKEETAAILRETGMSERKTREFDRERLNELCRAIEPAKNEHIAREAVTIAIRWLAKAENQAMQIRNLEDCMQRTRGTWIGGELGRCSICGHEGNASDIWNGCKVMFCPNCGAHIRREE